MKKAVAIATLFVIVFQSVSQTKEDVMSKAYRDIWNAEVQAQMDRDIERYRKADATVELHGAKPGTNVQIEQISHSFLFGGNIFLFGDFKTPEQNRQYENTFGDLFNAATVPFYWKTLEPIQGNPRFEAGSAYEYRRPPPDPVVEFCMSKNINMNGHAIIYGSRQWGHPEWMPENRKAMDPIFEAHVKQIAERYQDKIRRWDVVNESIDQANRGLMPDDYTYKTFAWAMKYFPETVQFNSNDCDMHWAPSRRYVEIVRDLIDRDIRINNVGLQMHIFNPAESKEIADGADILTPKKMYAWFNCLEETERPVHISEVTVSAPDETPAGQAIQAEITRNLYRLWFSYPTTMGITWWNVVDGGAAPGEPSFSGIYDKALNPKPVYQALDRLINHEWKTSLTLKADQDGKVTFRGFKGLYRISWKDKSGKTQRLELNLE